MTVAMIVAGLAPLQSMLVISAAYFLMKRRKEN
jgi:LPXTG-motif cell wall-anchored protein